MGRKMGDKVFWVSSSAGTTKRKEGEIVEVIPAKKDPQMGKKYGSKSKHGGGWPRNHESYIVKVGNYYYWPVVSLLKSAWGQKEGL